MDTNDIASVVDGVASNQVKLTARWLPGAADWMTGAIEGKVFTDTEEHDVLAKAVLACIEPVSAEEMPYSSCTDGRHRDTLLDGGSVPVREQLVGTDTMAAFVAAEALGERFYGDELSASVEHRIAKVVEFLKANGYKPTAHIGCGAAGGFTTVLERATEFIGKPGYVERLKALLSDDIYDPALHRQIVDGYKDRLSNGTYADYRDGLVCDIAEAANGQHCVEKYIDDGQGVHGHLEQAVVYLDGSVKGLAVNPSRLIDEYGLQVFVVNDARADAIARLFSLESGQQTDYLTARLAIEDFAAAGHGTLAHGMETLVVSAA